MLIVHGMMLTVATVAAAGGSLAGADQVAQVAGASAEKTTEKPVCRRYADVGSNIARRKICMNKQQWDKMARDSQELGRNMQPALTTGGGQ